MSGVPDGSDPAGAPTRPLRLVLVRHGQTPANIEHLLDTVLPGPGLTDLGREQAAALGRELAGGTDGPVEALYRSAARRAGETADVVGATLGLAPRTVEGLHEVQVGELEGRSDETSIARFRAVFDAWQGGDLDLAHAGGESGRDLLDRFRKGVEEIRGRHPGGGTVVVISHGAALRLVAQDLVEHVGTPGANENHVGNCGRVVVESRPAGSRPAWTLASWLGDVPGGLPSTRGPTG